MSKINKINVGGVSYDIEDTSKEALANKVTSLDAQSTDTEYPSAKAVWDIVKDKIQQLDVMPTPDSTWVGKVVQYIGSFSNVYDTGRFYIGTSTSSTYGTTYHWKSVDYFQRISNNYLWDTYGYLFQAPLGIYYGDSFNIKYGTNHTSTMNCSNALFIKYKDFLDGYGYTDYGIIISYDSGVLKCVKLSLNAFITSVTTIWEGSLLTTGAQTIQGVKNFNDLPESSVVPTQDAQFTNKKYVDDLVATKTIQYTIMPTASQTNEGKIVQYTGTTDSTYTNGYFYACVSDGQDPATYSWENIPVQDGDGNLSLHWIWQGYPDDSVGIIDFSAMSRGVYLLSNLFCYRNDSSGSITYKKKNGSTTSLTIDTGGTAFNYASRAIYITMPVSEISSTSSSGIIGSIDIVDLTNGTVHNRRLKYYPSDGTVALTKETKTPVIHYLTEIAQTITGVKTFSSIPQVSSYTAPTSNTQLTAKKYVDDAIAAISGGASVNYFDARQAFLFEGKDVGIYYPTNTNRINFMYNFLSGDSGGAKNGTVISLIIVNKVTAENPDSTKTYAVGTFLDGAGALQQFVVTYNGTNYVMTYYNNYYGAYMLTNYAQTINGIKTFGSFPVTPSSAPTSDYQTANKKYVDDLVGNINTVLATLTTPSNGGGN